MGTPSCSARRVACAAASISPTSTRATARLWCASPESGSRATAERSSIAAENPLGLYVTNLTWSKTSNDLEGEP